MHRNALSIIVSLIVILTGCEQPPQQTPVTTAPPPPPPSQMEIERVATQCNQCHDRRDPRSPLAPFLFGQHETYLIQATQHYRDGKRTHEEMNAITASLSDAHIEALARYYATEVAQWKGADMGFTDTAASPDRQLITHGKTLSPSCAACHGEQGISVRAGVPSLAGLDNSYLIKALSEYVNGTRANELMFVYKTTLDPQDIRALAAYYNSLPATRTTTRVQGRPAAAQTRRACSGCHGADGNPITPGMPRLAGQEETYLTVALTHYREGRRSDETMAAATATLSDTTLQRLAAYYAAQPPRTIVTGTLMLSETFDPVGDGKQLANGCDGCHASAQPGIPNLNGLTSNYLQDAMQAYRDGRRTHEAMRRFVSPFNELDLEKISLYYATQTPAAIAEPVETDDPAIADIINTCNNCHGPQGNSTNDAVPALAGQDAVYLAGAMAAYANGQRSHQDMANAVAQLTMQHFEALARHYAHQERQAPAVRLPQPAQLIAEKCDRCHGENGVSQQPNVPRLAGQVEAYLVSALRHYQNGKRDHSPMHAMSDVLTTLELRAIAHFYARQP